MSGYRYSRRSASSHSASPLSDSERRQTLINFGENRSTRDFSMVEKLGEGAYGSVWKAKHVSGKTYAIKKISSDDAEMVKHEIEFMRSISSPYIVMYMGSFFAEATNELWIVMEYCEFGSVKDMIKILDEGLTEEEVAALIKPILLSLKYLHGMSKIHRDIKAGNILLNEKGEAKLGDFGVSRELANAAAKRQTMIGTPYWMAPEVIMCDKSVGYSVAADIWSLGITCIEMIEKDPPLHETHPLRVVFLIPAMNPPTLKNATNYSLEFNSFIGRCLMKCDTERPSANELIEDPFITNAPNNTVLLPRLIRVEEEIKRHGRERAVSHTLLKGLNEEERERYESHLREREEVEEYDDTAVFVKDSDSKTESFEFMKPRVVPIEELSDSELEKRIQEIEEEYALKIAAETRKYNEKVASIKERFVNK